MNTIRHCLLAVVVLLCLLAPYLAGAEDVNLKDEQGQTVLMLAAQNGSLDHLKALLAGGAELNAKDENGNTALMFAANKGHADCLKALLAAGAERQNHGQPGRYRAHVCRAGRPGGQRQGAHRGQGRGERANQ